jgi:hypothetical protein
MIMKLRWAVCCCLFSGFAYGQIPIPAFNSYSLSRSALTFGLGDQGAALDGGVATMQYNPASIASLSGVSFETGKRDVFIVDPAYALSWLRVGVQLKGFGAFAIEYSPIDYGEVGYATVSPDAFSTTYFLEESYSLTYASCISESFSLGGAIRYIHSDLYPQTYAKHFFFSAGVLYEPVQLHRQISFGFSLMDFGTPVSYSGSSQNGAAPAYMRLGAAASPISDENQKLTFVLEGSRLVADVDNNYNAKSSFEALFTSFKYWPHDIDGHAGLIYSFPEIVLTNGLSIHQQLTFGLEDQSYPYRVNEINTSLTLGITAKRFTIDFGVASVWQYLTENVRETYFPKTIPDEELELRFSYSPRPAVSQEKENVKTILSAGIGVLSTLDRLKDAGVGSGISYTVELASYTSPSTAIVSSLCFEDNNSGGQLGRYDPDGRWHTFAVSMMYRYQNDEAGVPLYAQAGPALFRWGYSTNNRGITMYPWYRYFGGIAAEIGASVHLNKIIIAPYVDFITMLGPSLGSAPRLSGLNQWSVGVKLGTSL